MPAPGFDTKDVQSEANVGGYTMARNRLLIVDDSEAWLALSGKSLRRSGFQVLTTTAGTDVLRQVREDPPDLVIMDLSLPDVDGWWLLGRIANTFPPVPVVLHSSYPCEADFKAWAADAYVVKSADMRPLTRTVRRLLEASSRATRTTRTREGSRSPDGSRSPEGWGNRAGCPARLPPSPMTASQFARMSLVGSATEDYLGRGE